MTLKIRRLLRSAVTKNSVGGSIQTYQVTVSFDVKKARTMSTCFEGGDFSSLCREHIGTLDQNFTSIYKLGRSLESKVEFTYQVAVEILTSVEVHTYQLTVSSDLGKARTMSACFGGGNWFSRIGEYVTH